MALGTVRGVTNSEGLDVTRGAVKSRTTYGALDPTDISMQLHVLDLFHVEFSLALFHDLGSGRRRSEKPGFFFESVDVLCVRAEKLPLHIQSLEEVVCGRGHGHVNRGLEFGHECVEDLGRGRVAKNSGVEQIFSTNKGVGMLSLHERIKAVGRAKILRV